MKKYTKEEISTATNNMMNHGGGFVANLGFVLQKASQKSAKKIINTWKPYIEKYLHFKD